MLRTDDHTSDDDKKKVTGALLEISGSGATTDPKMIAFTHARAINHASGGRVIAPWEIDDLDDEWLEYAMGFQRLPSFQKGQKALEAQRQRWLNSNASYTKGRKH